MFALQGYGCMRDSVLGLGPEKALPTLQCKSGIPRTFSSVWLDRVGQTVGMAHILGLGVLGSGNSFWTPIPDQHVLGREQNQMNLHFQVVWNWAPLWGRQDQADEKLQSKGQSALPMLKCPQDFCHFFFHGKPPQWVNKPWLQGQGRTIQNFMSRSYHFCELIFTGHSNLLWSQGTIELQWSKQASLLSCCIHRIMNGKKHWTSQEYPRLS